MNNPNTGKRFKYFNVSSKVALASFFSGYLAFAVLGVFFLSLLANPARNQLRRRLKSAQKLNPIEYSILSDAEILGHRGVRMGAPENTLKAIQLAADSGADGVEIDARFTKDGVAILMHDPSVSRTIKGAKKKSTKKIRNLNFSDIKKLTTRGGEKIPTLEEALKLTQKLDMVVNLEIKSDDNVTEQNLDYILSLVNKYGNKSKFSISSFDEKIVKIIKEKDPLIITGLINYGVELDWIKKAKWAKVDYVNFHLMGLQLNSMEKIILCKQNNFAIKTWPVNDLKTAHELISSGLDGIISDNPKVLMARV